MRRKILELVLLAGLVSLAACSPTSEPATITPQPSRTGVLQPYDGPPPSTTPSPTNAATPTPLPSATPTPRTYTVVKNDDLWGIALRYGLSLEDLLTANPTVNPHFLSIGTHLKIPAPLYTATPDASHPPLPTPVGLDLAVPYCFPDKEGGLRCFTTAVNPQDFGIEAVSAVIRLYDLDSGEILSQTAFPPLNLLQPGGSLPLSAYFPAPFPARFSPTIELLTALPVPPASGRFLTVQQPGTAVQVSTDKLSAAVSGSFTLNDLQSSAGRVAAAAIAYAADGRVTGIRQWEWSGELPGGGSLPFEMAVYAAGDPIARVVVLVEAYPVQ